MSENKIPLLECPFDYLIGDATGKVLNEYATFPCKIMCGVYALMVSGSAKATVDITTYSVHAGQAVALKPGSFFLVHEFSEDALVYYIIFSSKFLEKNTYSSRLPMAQLLVKTPIIDLKPDQADVFKGMADLMIQASNTRPSLLNSSSMVHVFNMLHSAYVEYVHKFEAEPERAADRKAEIYYEYADLVMKHYHEWHHVSQYADAMRLTLPHICSTIKSYSGKTAGDMITDAILTDAKAQLKISSLQIKEIAFALGFENVAFFNRFFKSHTGVTPKVYRNS